MSLVKLRGTMDAIGIEIGTKHGILTPWYQVTVATLKKYGLHSELRYVDNSCYALLLKAYPEHTWEPWKFTKMPSIARRDPKVIEAALNYVEERLQLRNPEDWKSISREKLRELGVYELFRRRTAGPLISDDDIQRRLRLGKTSPIGSF